MERDIEENPLSSFILRKKVLKSNFDRYQTNVTRKLNRLNPIIGGASSPNPTARNYVRQSQNRTKPRFSFPSWRNRNGGVFISPASQQSFIIEVPINVSNTQQLPPSELEFCIIKGIICCILFIFIVNKKKFIPRLQKIKTNIYSFLKKGRKKIFNVEEIISHYYGF